MNWLLQFFFGCHHRRTTFPLTPTRGGRCYVACLDCGKKIGYDWNSMRISDVEVQA